MLEKLKKKIIQIDRKYCGCQQAAGYTKTQFLFYVVRILPTLPITYHKQAVYSSFTLFFLSFMIDFNALSTHHDNQKMNPILVHNYIWSPHKSPCHYNHHRLHTKTLQDIFFKTNYLRLIQLGTYQSSLLLNSNYHCIDNFLNHHKFHDLDNPL